MTKIYQTAIFLLLFAVTFVTGCRHASYSPELEAIDRLIAENPDSALSELSRISPDSLSEADRNLYNLLSVKAKDKANHYHLSDSIISPVLDYYSSHQDDPRFYEAMYYGGRVYSDLGDYPTALEKLLSAIGSMDEKSKNTKLGACIYSQAGWLENAIRNYEKAGIYISDAIRIDRLLKDTLNEIYDLELLGAINIHQKQYEAADSLINIALRLSENRYRELHANQLMFLAKIALRKNEHKRALSTIRKAVNGVHRYDKGEALAIATDIYLANNIIDTAYLYARVLVDSTNDKNRKLGLLRLLSPELRPYSSQAEIDRYITDYYSEIEDYMNTNGNRNALIQNSQFNYRMHIRQRQIAEHSLDLLKNWTIAILLILLCVVVILSISRIRNRNKVISLTKQLNEVRLLRHNLRNNHCTGDTEKDKNDTGNRQQDNDNLQQRLRKELNILYGSEEPLPEMPASLLKSQAYRDFTYCISNKNTIGDDNPLWDELEKEILKVSPDFRYSLQILLGDGWNIQNYRYALLIKCRFKSVEISKILHLARSTVSYRRTNLCEKLMGTKFDTKALYHMIAML